MLAVAAAARRDVQLSAAGKQHRQGTHGEKCDDEDERDAAASLIRWYTSGARRQVSESAGQPSQRVRRDKSAGQRVSGLAERSGGGWGGRVNFDKKGAKKIKELWDSAYRLGEVHRQNPTTL